MNKKNNLLVFTQVVDQKSTTLGFMHDWITRLSQVYDHLTVVCLFKGEYDLPDNVKVISLGKESNTTKNSLINRIKYAFYFYKVIFSEFRNYNKVFVHMNQEYVLLGGLFWKIMGRKIFMWRNHYVGGFLTKIAGKFCDKVFFTSKFSFTAQFKNGVKMPVGINIDPPKNKDKIEKKQNSILFLARLDPSKNPELVLRALKKIKDNGVDFTASFVGGTSDKFPKFEQEIHKLKDDLGLNLNVEFVGAVPIVETCKYYSSHDIYVNASKSGMFDKTIFEALVSGCLPVTSSVDFNEMVGDEFKFKDGDLDSLVLKLSHAINLKQEDKISKVLSMQDVVLKKHSLGLLIDKIFEEVK